MRVAKVFLICAALSLASAAFADVNIDFPLSSDTWDTVYEYWWNQGDTVYGDRDLETEEFDYVWVTLNLSYNGLAADAEVPLDLRLDSNTVFSWEVVLADGLGDIVYEGPITYTPAGVEEVRYYETAAVYPGGGAIIIAPDLGYIDFQTVVVGIEAASLGEIKAVFK
jgi:hypothetical protein